jgi:DNA-binding response OmpR family regulator
MALSDDIKNAGVALFDGGIQLGDCLAFESTGEVVSVKNQKTILGKLEPLGYDFLNLLAQSPGRLITSESLEEKRYSAGHIRTVVNGLRSLIDPEWRYIHTIPLRGIIIGDRLLDPDYIYFPNFKVDRETGLFFPRYSDPVLSNGQFNCLYDKESRLVNCLALKPGQTVSHADIGYALRESKKVLNNYKIVSSLRSKVDPNHQCIQTVVGGGLMYVPPDN